MIQAALFVTATVSLLFALIIFLNDVKSTLFRLYFLFGIFSALWMSVNAVVVGDPLIFSLNVRFQFAYWITPLALAVSFTFYLFLKYFTRHKLDRGDIVLAVPTLVISSLAFTPLNVYIDQNKEITTGGLFSFYLAVLILNIIFIFFCLYREHPANRNARLQLRYLKLGALTAIIPTIAFGAILPLFSNSSLSNIAPLFTLAFLFFAGVAIVKHRLFDIKLAAVRSLAYILSLFAMTAIYFVLAYGASLLIFKNHVDEGISMSPVNIILALILAFIFQPLKKFFDKITNDIFYRDTYSSDIFFAKLSSLLTSTTDLRGLLETASNEIAVTFKAEQVFFHLDYTNGGEHHMSSGTSRHANMPVYDVHLLTSYAETISAPIFLTNLIADKNEKVRRMLLSHKIELVMPLRLADRIIGYMLLGEHLGGYYTKRDLKVLSTTSNELVIAIQNALSLHEVKELNETLQQRIDVATKELRSSNAQLKHIDEVKDEFMSMASHQLRTPLTSVKGYISMVLEGDAGKISPQQQKLLLEAFKSSERMVGLIGDFLNISRLQTGRFIIEKTPFDLKDVVKQEIADLGLIAHSHDIKLRAKLGDGHFPVVADEQKIRQVIMNFVDNAIYYSHSNDTIVINLEQTKGVASLTVVDTGIGVPAAEQARLFNKFFRAQNARKARPDGTGVGLYLARRVIGAHGGQIIFSSKEGKGSTFGFSLPLSTQVVAKPKEDSSALVTSR